MRAHSGCTRGALDRELKTQCFEWGGWGVGAFPDFASIERDYTGKVVGGLSSAKGNAIRCKFRVNDPQVGFISGGSGACQVSLGGHILLHF